MRWVDYTLIISKDWAGNHVNFYPPLFSCLEVADFLLYTRSFTETGTNHATFSTYIHIFHCHYWQIAHDMGSNSRCTVQSMVCIAYCLIEVLQARASVADIGAGQSLEQEIRPSCTREAAPHVCDTRHRKRSTQRNIIRTCNCQVVIFLYRLSVFLCLFLSYCLLALFFLSGNYLLTVAEHSLQTH
jgi:hypothetical protein